MVPNNNLNNKQNIKSKSTQDKVLKTGVILWIALFIFSFVMGPLTGGWIFLLLWPILFPLHLFGLVCTIIFVFRKQRTSKNLTRKKIFKIIMIFILIVCVVVPSVQLLWVVGKERYRVRTIKHEKVEQLIRDCKITSIGFRWRGGKVNHEIDLKFSSDYHNILSPKLAEPYFYEEYVKEAKSVSGKCHVIIEEKRTR